ncbi:MAG: Mov34/MPN/PAD-1 family protein [Gemmatimonadales bacterium]
MADGSTYAFGVAFERLDGSPIERVDLTPDWEPARERFRLLVAERGVDPSVAFALEPLVEPRWSGLRGAPFVSACRLRAGDRSEPALDLGIGYFAGSVQRLSSELVTRGLLGEGERYCATLIARPRAEGERPRRGALRRRARVPIRPASLAALERCAVAHEDRGDNDPLWFVPGELLEQARARVASERERETGGVLVGHLCRDPARGRLFVLATGQIPALAAVGDATSLSFTAETWTETRAELDRRARGEIMVGWWHSHPVHLWCRDCTIECRRLCALDRGMFSESDRRLHRTVFPRAFAVGLVLSDTGNGPPGVAAFGWRDGLIARRGYHTLPEGAIDVS